MTKAPEKFRLVMPNGTAFEFSAIEVDRESRLVNMTTLHDPIRQQIPDAPEITLRLFGDREMTLRIVGAVTVKKPRKKAKRARRAK